jgi:hypothetical protein
MQKPQAAHNFPQVHPTLFKKYAGLRIDVFHAIMETNPQNEKM